MTIVRPADLRSDKSHPPLRHVILKIRILKIPVLNPTSASFGCQGENAQFPPT